MEIVNSIAENLGIEVENLAGLEKSPKATLKTLELATGAQKAVKSFNASDFDTSGEWLREGEPWHNRS